MLKVRDRLHLLVYEGLDGGGGGGAVGLVFTIH